MPRRPFPNAIDHHRPNQQRTRSYSNLIPPLAALAAITLAGCAGPAEREILPTHEPTTLAAPKADSDDVPRALRVALEAVEAALLEERWHDGAYHARGLLIESRSLRAHALPNGRGGYTLSAYVRPMGDARTQRVLLEAWRDRLEQLHGVAWAPR